MHAPGLQWRGATSAPFPGYLLIGRGEDFATTLTSASSDIIDQYVERLCQGSDEKYVFQGQCRPMGHFNAGTLNGDPVEFLTTVHGPVEGYATMNGQKVAISSKRSSYGRDVLDQILFPRLLLPRSGEDASDLQLVLHRQRAHRHVHERQAADPAARRRSRPTRSGHRGQRVAGLFARQRAHEGRGPPRWDDHELEQHRRARVRRFG
jgi:hypothetical protein